MGMGGDTHDDIVVKPQTKQTKKAHQSPPPKHISGIAMSEQFSSSKI